MPVQTPNSIHAARKQMRQRVRDAMSGIDRIRKRTTKYIPLPDSKCDEKSQRYIDYINRAYYLNLPQRTVSTLSGLLSNKEPELVLPSLMSYLHDNADGAGNPLLQQIKDATDEVLQLGRGGVCAIFKEAPLTGINAANQSQYLPLIRGYKEENIINWRVKDGQLVMLVLREQNILPSPDDEFRDAIQTSYRVFNLNGDGVTQRLYQSDEASSLPSEYFDEESAPTAPEAWTITSQVLTVANGKPMRQIPFSFIGSVNNDADCDPSPILNICDLALTYYRLSADEQLNVHLASCGILTISTELEKAQWDEFNGSTDIDTSWGALFLGNNGKAEFVQASEATVANQSMDRVLSNAVSIGAQIITDAVTDKTATEARINNSSNTSQLVQISRNISEAYTSVLRVIAESLNASGDCYLALSTEFFDSEASPDMIRAYAEAVLKGEISRTDFLNWQKKVGIISKDRSVDDVISELSDADDERALLGAQMMKPNVEEDE